MTDEASRIARLEENMQEIDDWRKACSMLPITVAELVEWKRMQNGFLRDLRDDMRAVRDQQLQAKGAIRLMRWALGLSGSSVAYLLIERLTA